MAVNLAPTQIAQNSWLMALNFPASIAQELLRQVNNPPRRYEQARNLVESLELAKFPILPDVYFSTPNPPKAVWWSITVPSCLGWASFCHRLLRRTGEILADEKLGRKNVEEIWCMQDERIFSIAWTESLRSRKTRCVSVRSLLLKVWQPLDRCCLWLFVADVCFNIQVVIEQQGEDASKHEHRYLVYCHKIVVESSVLDKSIAASRISRYDNVATAPLWFRHCWVGFGFSSRWAARFPWTARWRHAAAWGSLSLRQVL